MTVKKLNLISLLAVLWLSACSPNPEEQANALLLQADSLYQTGRYDKSKILIDSLDRNYRHQIDQRRQARVLLDRIKVKEETRNAQYLDSLIVLMEPEVNELMKQFVLSKDSAYVKEKIYTHRKQTVGYYPHTNLTAQVYENGDIDLISVFCGYALNHTQVEVKIADMHLETGVLPVGNAYNYQFSDEGVRWEYLTFKGAAQNGLLAFIASTDAKERVRVVLHGDKTHTYYLEPTDRQALTEAYQFAGKMKEFYNMKKQSRNAKEKTRYLLQKLDSL